MVRKRVVGERSGVKQEQNETSEEAGRREELAYIRKCMRLSPYLWLRQPLPKREEEGTRRSRCRETDGKFPLL